MLTLVLRVARCVLRVAWCVVRGVVCSGFWMHYTIFTAVFFVLFVCDLMFLSETSFLYDPDLKSWAQKSGVASADY